MKRWFEFWSENLGRLGQDSLAIQVWSPQQKCERDEPDETISARGESGKRISSAKSMTAGLCGHLANVSK